MRVINEAGKKVMRDVSLAFVRIHVLHHAAEGRIFGLEMMDELKRHGHSLSPGTLYPLLHALEAGGVLVSSGEVVNGKVRKYYRTTRTGDALLRELRARVRELVGEVLESRPDGMKRTRRKAS
jgi:PadR family transcriptional regulator, regulatory protein PadR